MTQKQTYLKKYSKLLLFFITILFLFSFYNFKVYAFDPNDYKPNYNEKHCKQEWKHEGGSVFSINSRVFYDISGVKMVPCKSYQEWGNTKQLAKDGVLISLGFWPGVGHVANWINDGADVLGINDRIFNKNDDKIAMLNDIVYYYLEQDPGKGFFFFDINELENIKEVDIAFCDCDKHVFLINELLESFLKQEELDTTYVDPLKDTEKGTKRFLEQKSKKLIVKKINKKVGHKIAQTIMKKAAKKTVGRFFGRIFMPGIVTAYDKVEQIRESENNLKKRIKFDVQNNSYEKTNGFVIHFVSENELEIYELKQKYNDERNYRLVERINISNSDHMLINVLKTKNNQELNIYSGKLK
ncbi:putative secreted protein [Candidatus Phytoplasma solani]|uniref:hypothetical protein n=1 Tax=Candidatus Phytoplasma solani TaxID=69896 RepID=UPI0032DB33EB